MIVKNPTILGVSLSKPIKSSIKYGDTAHLSCVVEASDVGVDIEWYKGDSTWPLVNDDSKYTISTYMASSKSKQSTSDLSIHKFDANDVGEYSCTVHYADPILDDSSPKQALTVLGMSKLS